MTIQVELDPDLEARLYANASGRGQDLDAYLKEILEIAACAQAGDASSGMGKPGRGRSLLELEGLGAELWQRIDAQKYVDQLRSEWDQRP
jgi:hypothetical protein